MASAGIDYFLVKPHMLWPQQALMFFLLNSTGTPDLKLYIMASTGPDHFLVKLYIMASTGTELFLLNFISWPQ